jgi:hypothetical protein
VHVGIRRVLADPRRTGRQAQGSGGTLGAGECRHRAQKAEVAATAGLVVDGRSDDHAVAGFRKALLECAQIGRDDAVVIAQQDVAGLRGRHGQHRGQAAQVDQGT